MTEYNKASDYIACAKTPKQKLKRIEALIDVLMNSVLVAVENAHVEEYSLDDGQTKINQIFRSPEAVLATVKTLEGMRQIYIIRCTGRIVKLVDISNFRKHGR